MSLFSNVTTDESIKNETDSLGGAKVLDSDIYLVEITMAYGKASNSGALGLHITGKTESDDTIEQSFYVTSGTDKGQKNYTEKDGVKQYLPGFNQATSLCLLTVGKELDKMDVEQKQVQIYDPTQKKRVPTKVDVLVELIGQKVYMAIEKQVVTKQVKQGNTYVDDPAGGTREQNEVVKMFREKDKLSTAEIRDKKTEAGFFTDWLARWKGQTRNKTSRGGASGATAGAPNTTAAANGKPTQSLFGA